MNSKYVVILNIIPLFCFILLFIVKLILIFMCNFSGYEINIMGIEWLTLMIVIPVYYVLINCRTSAKSQYTLENNVFLNYSQILFIIIFEFIITLLPTIIRIRKVDSMGIMVWISVLCLILLIFTIEWCVKRTVNYFIKKQ